MSDDPPTTVGGVKSAKDQFMKTREGTLQLAREYIDSHYDDFANSTLTFRNLKNHLAESTGLPYSAFANDQPLGASLDDEVEAITKRCDTGKVDKACIFAADFVPPPEPDEPAAKASQQGGKPAKAATATISPACSARVRLRLMRRLRASLRLGVRVRVRVCSPRRARG